jgi:hypothetical protein
VATLQPWLRVEFDRLFGHHFGPPGWHSQAGFTCLCTSALVAIMALAESPTHASRDAVRPGSLLLVVIAAVVIACEWLGGPGELRGVSARWTWAFYAALTGATALTAACTLRWLTRR